TRNEEFYHDLLRQQCNNKTEICCTAKLSASSRKGLCESVIPSSAWWRIGEPVIESKRTGSTIITCCKRRNYFHVWRNGREYFSYKRDSPRASKSRKAYYNLRN